MSIDRWQPREELNRQEQMLMKRLDRVRKLLGFLRVYRRRLFDDAFQDELAAMYRDTGAGKPPVPPALMAMGAFVQAYLGVSDAEMVELTVVDLRVQMVLDRLGADGPAFSQGALVDQPPSGPAQASSVSALCRARARTRSPAFVVSWGTRRRPILKTPRWEPAITWTGFEHPSPAGQRRAEAGAGRARREAHVRGCREASTSTSTTTRRSTVLRADSGLVPTLALRIASAAA